ncbi:hypothetical protein EYF80_037787 [Liparis tanakae]|uniref:Uncharacterized protein n=1 Tax=Liparis tanakae TaxID=230148 RepID=A0A4Z2GGK7_9TELE|nr:hypothetical protein EYF80_037787 [Liparis tanakae]
MRAQLFRALEVLSETMKLSQNNVASLAIAENMEMVLFASGQRCVVTSTHKTEERSHGQEPEVQTSPLGHQAHPRAKPTAKMEADAFLGFVEEIEIEMEVLSALKVSERVAITPHDPSIITQVCEFRFLFPDRHITMFDSPVQQDNAGWFSGLPPSMSIF